MQVSAVLPIHNEADVLADVLDCIEGQVRRPDELILVFDRCTDASQRIASGRADREVVVEFGNTGAAVRAGIAHARHETIVLFDGNTVVPPGYVNELVRAFAATGSDITEWHGGLMLLTKATVSRFGPPSDKALWTLEYFLRVKAAGGTVAHLDREFVRLKRSPLPRNFRYGLDYADLSWQHGLSPFFRIGTKSGWVPDLVATAGTFAGHVRVRRLVPAISKAFRSLPSARAVDGT